MGKWTRRAFITTGVLAGGLLVVGVAIRPGNRSKKVRHLIAGEGDTVMNVWLKIAKDNIVTAIIPHAEMGQGVHTTLSMMLADEMDADWSKVRFEEAPAHKEYANYAIAKGFITGDKNFPAFLDGTIDGVFLTATKRLNLQITGGSGSVRFTGMYAMRVAGAAAKAMLLKAAAKVWEIPVAEISAKDSYIHDLSGNRSAPFAEFAEQAAKLSKPAHPKLKSEKEFKIMGTSPPRFDIPAKVDGTANFGLDVRPKELKYASIMAAPVFGSKVKTVDEAGIQNMPGVLKVIHLEEAVAVIADGYWQAQQALKKLNIEFEENDDEARAQSNIMEQFENDMNDALANGKLETDFESGNIDKVLVGADEVIEAEYRVPYLAHACMEPMNCTAWVQKDKCEIWTGTQNPLGVKAAAAEALDIEDDLITVHNQFMGGGFGRRAETDVIKQAVLIAKTVDYPVQLIWSREETMQHDFYREANISRFKAVLNDAGQPIAWENQFLDKHHPPDAPYIPYKIDNQLIRYSHSKTHVPWGNWRSVDHSMHAFFTESFIDELAHKSNKDPYEYRRQLLAHQPRFLKVLELAADKAEWKKQLPPNWGRGIAIHQSFGTIVAEVVKVEITEGTPKVHRVICAADPGFAIHPNGFKAQMESGIIYGLTAALYGEITIENGAVAQSNFHNYEMVRMKDAPDIEMYIINSGHKLGGAGEPSTPAIAPALANAIFDATNIRLRELPIKKQVLKAKQEKGKILGVI